MAFSSQGLIGPGQGPEVAVRGSGPRAVVLQMEGGTIWARAHMVEGHTLVTEITESGTYDLPECAYVSFIATEEAGPHVSCAVHYDRD